MATPKTSEGKFIVGGREDNLEFLDCGEHNEVKIEGGFISKQQEKDFIDVVEEYSFVLKKKSKQKQYTLRNCFKCGMIMSFELFELRNRLPKKQLEKIWESEYVELFCCTCYKIKDSEYITKEKRERLLNKAERICEKFGFVPFYTDLDDFKSK